MSEQSKPTVQQLKKKSSYTYWVDQNKKGYELPEEHRPKKIDPPINENSSSIGPSKWNTLGSWQQRSISMKQLSENVEGAIKEWIAEKGSELVVKETKLEGQFKQIFSNNKRKVFYQISGKVQFEGEDLQLKLQEISCAGDREFKAKGKNKEQKEKLQNVASKIIQVIVQMFNRYKE